MGARPRSGPDGQLVHREEGSRQRDDRRPQRVRGWARTTRSVLLERVCRPRTSGTTTASPRSARGRHRERADRPPAGLLQDATTSPTTRSCSSPGKFDEAKTLGARSTSIFGAIPQPTRTLPAHLHDRADAGRRARGHAAPRRRRAARRRASTTCPPGRTRTSRRVDLARPGPRRHAVGPAVQGAGRDEEGEQSVGGFDFQLHDPGDRDVRRRGAAGHVARRRARRAAARRSSAIAPAAHGGRSRARARRSC